MRFFREDVIIHTVYTDYILLADSGVVPGSVIIQRATWRRQ